MNGPWDNRQEEVKKGSFSASHSFAENWIHCKIYEYLKYLTTRIRKGDTKGSLISEGIFTLFSLPTKGAKSHPWTESLNFPPFTVNNLFKFSAQGRDLAPFFGNGIKVKIPSEIKPPLYSTDISSLQLFFGSHSCMIRCSATFLTKNYLQQTTTSKHFCQKNIKKDKWIPNSSRIWADSWLEKQLKHF